MINNYLYPIWRRIGYSKWNYRIFRVWSWVGVKLNFKEKILEEYDDEKTNIQRP